MERVEKLEQRIADVELEAEKLVQLSPKDLWTTDLEEFINAYRHEMEEEAQLARDNKKKVRRISMANKTNKKASKRKAANDSDDDADFGMVKAKKKPAIERVENKRNGLFDFFSKQSPPSKPAGKYVLVDSKEQSVSVPAPHDGAADVKEEDAVPAPRGGRAAARKPVRYAVSDDDSDQSGDDMLGDVSAMAKGIGGGDSSRALFRNSISRPNSSGNPPNGHSKTASRGPSKSTVIDLDEDIGVDDTDYVKLVPKDSPQKPAARTAKDVKVSDDDDDEDNEDSLDVLAPSPAKKASKPAPAPKSVAAPKPKKAPAQKATKAASVEPAAPKPVHLSPAAKAYAKKIAGKTAAKPESKPTTGRGRAKKTVISDVSDEDEDPNDLANDLLDDDDDDDGSPAPVKAPAPAPAPAPAGRARRAAPAKKYNYVVSDDSENDDDNESEADFDDDSE